MVPTELFETRAEVVQNKEAIMAKVILSVIVAAFLSVAALLGGTSSAAACEVNCGPSVPDATYGGGGVKVHVVKATACFTADILEFIGDKRGPFPYTVAFVYNPAKGTHEVIKTVKNRSPCWSHNVAIGTWMAVYVTCKSYTGWVAVQITGPGTYTMKKVPWTFVENL
jgi:hypothetical protein